ncbi:MAG: hypothetical protein ACYSYV_03435 [Planctomycetota bacterium]|jgi:hypothetical protein
MNGKLSRTRHGAGVLVNQGLGRFVAAALVYSAFAVYLYQPHFKNFETIRYLLVVNACLASLGCYLLSRRWVAGFAESFFAGAIYGFGPFTLGLAKFHPTAGFLVAAIPWLFCPAVFGPEARWRWLRVPFSVLPFLAIVLFFQAAAHYRLYPIPIQLKLRTADLAGFLAPLVAAKRGMTLIGFYHIPIAALIMGFAMLLAPLEILRTGGILQKGRFLAGLAARRFGIMAVFAIGTILAFCDSSFDVSPVIWFAITVLCCSILAGAGMQGLVCAGFADRRWVLFTAIVMGALSVATLLLATKYFQTFLGIGQIYADLLTEAAKMYILGAITVAILFFMARAKLRIHPLRQALLCATMVLDIFLGATFIVDKVR